MKRLILSTVCMLFCATGLWAQEFIDYNFQEFIDGIYYNFDEGTLTASVTNIDYGPDFPASGSYSGSITIPSTVVCNGTSYIVTSIGNDRFGHGAFESNGGLTSVTIPNSVTSIGKRAFYNCGGLTSVTIPNSVTSIGLNAFYNVKHVIYTGSATGSPWGAIAVNGFVDGDFVFSDNTKTQLAAYIGNGGDVSIPNSVTSIGDAAFRLCSGLTSVTIPNSVTSIGGSAFMGCTGLTSVTIPNSVTSIGENAFSGCTGLTSVTIGNGVTSIGKSAFYNCGGLTSVTIPNSVTSIGDYAFCYCGGLKEVINKSDLNITQGSTANGYVAYYADYVCNGGKTVIDDFIFSDRDKTLVKYIGDGGDITLPEDFNGEEYTVGANMFDGSAGLTSIIVPCDRYDYFKGAITRYSSIVYGNCTFEIAAKANNEDYGTVTGNGVYNYAKNITLTATPNDHYHFVKWDDGNTEKTRTVTVTQDSTFTAVFAIDEHNVTVSKNISAAGSVTGDGVYEYNTTVQLTATANEGYRFKGWSDGVIDASREITVTKDIDITANFVALYTLKTIASASQGSASGGGIYEHGEIATLVANAKPGYVFAQWADGNDENPRYVTVDGNKTYTAIFIEGEQDKYMITWKNWDGRVIKTSEVSYGEVPVFNGEKPTRPDEAGYTFTFSGWSPTIAAASQNAEYTANYIQTATEAEKTTIENEGDISITITDNTALFTWPENASADSYTLTITRNDEVFCSLTFDGQGRLINLNFPNLRASAEGYRFTVTGLNSGTDYAYDLKAKNGAVTVNEYTGEFRTSGDATTAVPEAEKSIVETARYDINGRKLNAPTKGVNIVTYSDGSFEKEFVR